MGMTAVSIVIPTFGRPDSLRACLRHLQAQQFDMSSAEVIVVNDGGPGPVARIVEEERGALAVVVRTKPNGGPASARNLGAASARGRFLAFIDDDCAADPGWLRGLFGALASQPDAVVGGPVINALTNNPYASASQSVATFAARRYASGLGAESFFTTNNFAVASELFRVMGGFDETIPSWTAEDKEFCDRWRARGWPMVWVPTATVNHSHHLNFRRFLRQHFDYGRGILTFRLRRENTNGTRLIPESAGFYAGLVLHPLKSETPSVAVRTIGLLALSQFATAAGALSAGIEIRRTRESRRVRRVAEEPSA